MTETPKKPGGELFIVDNADDHWTAHRYLHDWCDIAHYQRIVVALKETIRLMAEIDEAIEAHSGWPIE